MNIVTDLQRGCYGPDLVEYTPYHNGELYLYCIGLNGITGERYIEWEYGHLDRFDDWGSPSLEFEE